MISIKTSPNADSRTATEKVSLNILLLNSQQHIEDVKHAMDWMADFLKQQSECHDWTKIRYIEEFHHDVKQSQDGFQGDFKQEHWYKDLHLQERHHLNDKVPDDVNLFDVLERVADCVMAGMARSGSVYEEAISPEMLVKAYCNTIELLKTEVKVIIEGK